MKKTLRNLALAATLVASGLSASALDAIYLVGSGTVNGQSLPGSPSASSNVKVEGTDNTFTFTVKNIGWLKISDTNASDWTTFNNGGFCVQDKGDYNLSESDLGKELTIWYGSGLNINPPDNGEFQYKLVVGTKNSNNTRLTVTRVGEIEIPETLYIRGDFSNNDWGAVDAGKLSATSEWPNTSGQYVYSLSSPIEEFSGDFKIDDGNWTFDYGYGSGGNTITPGTMFNVAKGGGNISTGSDIYSNVNFKFYYNPTGDSYVEMTGEASKPDFTQYTVQLMVNNSFVGSPVNADESGVATISNYALGTNTFQVVVTNANSVATYYNKADAPLTPDVWTSVSNQYESTLSVAGAQAGDIYDISFNCDNLQVMVHKAGQEEVEYPEQIYVIGDFAGGFNPTQGKEMTGEDGVYTLTGASLASTDNGYGYFGFASQLMETEDWNTFNQTYRYGAQSANEVPELDTPVRMYQPSENSWKLPEGIYDITVSLVDMTVTLTEVKPTAPAALYMIGGISDWDIVNGLGADFQLDGNTYTAENVQLPGTGTYYFRFVDMLSTDGDWPTYEEVVTQYGSNDANGTPVELSEAMGFGIGTNTWTIAGGTYTFTLDFEELTLTVEGTANEEQEYQPTGKMYFQGNEGVWSTNAAPEMEGSDGVFTFTATFTEAENYFSFCDALVDNENDWNSTTGLNFVANRFGPATSDAIPNFGDDNEVVLYQAGVDAASCLSWKVEAGTYNITLNLNDMNMMIEEAAEPEAPVVTASPEPGSYDEAQLVTLTVTPELSLIYYTTDGTEPTQDSQYLYSTPITVDQNMTIKVLAVSPDNVEENFEFAYTINTTAIGSILGDNAEGAVEVYDLSGRQIKADTLKPGMYIIRRGGEAQKVLVK